MFLSVTSVESIHLTTAKERNSFDANSLHSIASSISSAGLTHHSVTSQYVLTVRNRNRKLQISTAPTRAKLQEPAYSQALIENKIDRQRVRSREYVLSKS